MRIGFDLFERATYPFRGIARYEQHLAAALMSLDTADEFIFLSPTTHPPDLLPGLVGTSRHKFSTPCRTLKQRKLLWLASNLAHLPLDTRLGSVDLFHAPDFVGPWLANTPLVITIHDLAPWLYPETRTWRNSVFYHVALPISAHRASYIITDSNSVARDVADRWPWLAKKTATVHLAPAPHYSPVADEDLFEDVRRRLQLPDRYILSVGTLEPRKNYPLLLEAFDALIRQKPNCRDIKLLIVGKEGWHCRNVLKTIEGLDLDERVVLTHSVPDDELCQLYIHCQVLVQPSFYEGFGLPIVEAMACGAPVITSTAAALKEVAGDAAIAVDPRRPHQLVAALDTVVHDPQRRKEMREQGFERADSFSWDRAARDTYQVYQKAVQNLRDKKP